MKLDASDSYIYSPNQTNFLSLNNTNVFLRRGNSGIHKLIAYSRIAYNGGYYSDWTASYFRTGTATENSIYINADSTTIYSPLGDSNGKIKLTSLPHSVLLVGADKIHGFSVIEAGLEWGAYSNDLDSLQFAFRHNAPGMSDAAGDSADLDGVGGPQAAHAPGIEAGSGAPLMQRSDGLVFAAVGGEDRRRSSPQATQGERFVDPQGGTVAPVCG